MFFHINYKGIIKARRTYVKLYMGWNANDWVSRIPT